MSLPVWLDPMRCPLNAGDLICDAVGLKTIVSANRQSSPQGAWLVTRQRYIVSATWFGPLLERPFQNVTTRHRLERAARTVQRAWRGRKLSRVIRGRGLPDGVCDLIAKFAVEP